MKCAIFGNGSFKNFDIVHKFTDIDNTFIIGVDGGCNYLVENNIKIDIIIGDFDSLKYKEVIDTKRHILKTDMNYNDLELAMKYCLENNFSKIYLFGFTGKRSDHLLFNLRVVEKFFELGLDISIVDEFNLITLFNGEKIFKQESFEFFSLLPIYEDTIISIEGSMYDLKDKKLNRLDTLTLSNSWVREKVKIKTNKLIYIYLVF